MRRLLAAVALLAACLPASTAAAPRAAPVPPPVTLPRTETHVLRSAINGREYHIAVALPPGAAAGPADTTRHPVLYVLDGGAHLPLLASMLRLTNRSGATGNVILVGVGYYAPQDFQPAVPGQPSPRSVDYSPPPLPPAPGAGATTAPPWTPDAPAFLRVLREEVIPFVERTYRTTTERALHGHSLGGLFATYALFEDPDLFDRYAIMSPYYQWDDGSIFARESAFRARRDGLPKQVYLAVGGLEGPEYRAGMWRMVAALCAGRRAGDYAGLRVSAEVIPDEHHNSAAIFGRSLKALFPPYAPPEPAPDPCAGR